MTLALSDLAAGDYDLLLDGVDVAIADAGAGLGSATLEFDSVPDVGAGELPLPAGATPGASIAIQGKAPLGMDVVPTGLLP